MPLSRIACVPSAQVLGWPWWSRGWATLAYICLQPTPPSLRPPAPPQSVRTLLKGWAGRITLFRKWREVYVASKGNGDHYSKVGGRLLHVLACYVNMRWQTGRLPLRR